jgi:hypothetical protein
MKTPWLAIPVLLLAACAASDSMVQTRHKPKESYKLERTSDCISKSLVSGFQALDDRHILLYGSGRRKTYLIEIAPACFDIARQYTLGTVDGDNNGQICGFGRDSIVYEQMGRVETCRVLGMEELSEERLNKVMSKK